MARSGRRKVITSRASVVNDAPYSKIDAELPEPFSTWFASRGWRPREHQLALVSQAKSGRPVLLIAPTGGGKTLAGFLPSLISLQMAGKRRRKQLHTIYISPLKALASDVARNLLAPVEEMGLGIRIETRSGDTSIARRRRQRESPPDILLTTPEQLALLLSHEDSDHLFSSIETVILDELHALAGSKRGDLLALGLARISALAPKSRRIGLSATVARPTELQAYLSVQLEPEHVTELSDIIHVGGGAAPDIGIIEADEPLPWAGHSARYAMPRVYEAIRSARLSLVFVNTRSQAELVFQELWRLNEDALPIALHHGSLDAVQRRRVEAAMAAGRIRAVVATSTLDLGIDWGDVDLVINVGAPKGASRLIQRVGRANHRLDEPSKALLVPANRFEVLECRAALEAAKAGTQDTVLSRSGALDVLAQHVWGRACAGPFRPSELFEEVRSASPFSALTRSTFDRVVDFAATGGYSLRVYERFARLKEMDDGRLRLSHPRLANTYRMNAGTIVEAPMIKVRLGGRRKSSGEGRVLAGGRVLGELEEWFLEQLAPGDTFVFAGEVLRFEGLRDTEAFVTRAEGREPKIPTYQGGKFPLSTHLAQRVRNMLADRRSWKNLPSPVADWLELQRKHSIVPAAEDVLMETFPRGGKHFLVAYPFEGRLAHQTLGMLLTRRLDRAGMSPIGFVANDYGICIWGLGDLSNAISNGEVDLGGLFDADMLGDDLDAWLRETSLMKRTFRMCAVIAGLVERRHPGKVKSGRQVTVSSDLIYDVLKRNEPNHILLEAAWADAATGLLDIRRLSEFLTRIKGHIRHVALSRISPLSVPVILEIGRERVYGGSAQEDLLSLAAGASFEDLMTKG